MFLDFLTQYYGVDIVAMVLTFTGIYFIGNKRKGGFIVAMAGNIVWMGVGIWIHSIGLIFANIVIFSIYVRNYLKWNKEFNQK